MTDSSANIINGRWDEVTGGGLMFKYEDVILDSDLQPTTATKVSLSIPSGISFMYIGYILAIHNGAGDSQHFVNSGYKSVGTGAEFEMQVADERGERGTVNLYGLRTDTNSQVWRYKTGSGTAAGSGLYTNGYIDERL